MKFWGSKIMAKNIFFNNNQFLTMSITKSLQSLISLKSPKICMISLFKGNQVLAIFCLFFKLRTGFQGVFMYCSEKLKHKMLSLFVFVIIQTIPVSLFKSLKCVFPKCTFFWPNWIGWSFLLCGGLLVNLPHSVATRATVTGVLIIHTVLTSHQALH